MIIMVGVPGSGKSFFAEKFAETFHAPYVSYERIAHLLQDSAENIDPIIHYQLDELLKTQQSIIIDGIADTRTSRIDLSKKAHAAGYSTLLVWVQTDQATAKGRSVRQTKNDAHHILTPEEYDKAIKRFSPPAATEKPVVISGKHTYATQAKVILKKLSEPRANISVHATAPVRPEQPGRRNITIR
jgi:predicted kinase